MEAKVVTNFIDSQQNGKAFTKDATWKGSRERFDEINGKAKQFRVSAFLEEVKTPSDSDKEAKPATTTKERKLKNETK